LIGLSLDHDTEAPRAFVKEAPQQNLWVNSGSGSDPRL
jgi:hypothetical protein